MAPLTSVLEEVAADKGFASEWRGDELSQHGEVCGAVGTGGERVERVVASSPHGALIWDQI